MIWLVGQNRFDYESWQTLDEPWEVCGVFDSEAMAVEACRDFNYWIMPLEMNEQLPHESVSVSVDGGYYPWFNYETGEWRKDGPRMKS